MEATALNLRHLKSAIVIAATGSVSAAARLAHLTQPAISQGLAKLEREIGMRLFERTLSGMEPTEAARILEPRAQAALALIASARVTGTQMRAFNALARHGSYAGASIETGTSVSSLYRAVADLSLNLGVKLVERRGRRVALTSRGVAVARRFHLADAELRAALAELEALAGRKENSAHLQ